MHNKDKDKDKDTLFQVNITHSFKKTCKYNDDICYLYMYNNLIHGFHISNFIFHELSMQLIIELLLTFNRSIKSTTRFLIKISKLSM